MNKEKLEGNWNQLKGKVQEKWGKLTNDDLDVIQGRRDQLL
ncbi:MAG: CsbD family protein, partial [Bdellovibrionales bacterium]|nr:CsbD family protein [Bdellovibrionales bacterium]